MNVIYKNTMVWSCEENPKFRYDSHKLENISEKYLKEK